MDALARRDVIVPFLADIVSQSHKCQAFIFISSMRCGTIQYITANSNTNVMERDWFFR